MNIQRGRPQARIKINLNDPLKSVEKVKLLCEMNQEYSNNAFKFASALVNSFKENVDASCQWEATSDDLVETILEDLFKLNVEDQSYVVQAIITNIDEQE